MTSQNLDDKTQEIIKKTALSMIFGRKNTEKISSPIGEITLSRNNSKKYDNQMIVNGQQFNIFFQ